MRFPAVLCFESLCCASDRCAVLRIAVLGNAMLGNGGLCLGRFRSGAGSGVLCWRIGLLQRQTDFLAVVGAAVSPVRFYFALSLAQRVALSSPSFSRGRDLRREPKIKIVRC